MTIFWVIGDDWGWLFGDWGWLHILVKPDNDHTVMTADKDYHWN